MAGELIYEAAAPEITEAFGIKVLIHPWMLLAISLTFSRTVASKAMGGSRLDVKIPFPPEIKCHGVISRMQ